MIRGRVKFILYSQLTMSLRSLAIILHIHLHLQSLASMFATLFLQLPHVCLWGWTLAYMPLQQLNWHGNWQGKVPWNRQWNRLQKNKCTHSSLDNHSTEVCGKRPHSENYTHNSGANTSRKDKSTYNHCGLPGYLKSDCIHFKHTLDEENTINDGTTSLTTAGDSK